MPSPRLLRPIAAAALAILSATPALAAPPPGRGGAHPAPRPAPVARPAPAPAHVAPYRGTPYYGGSRVGISIGIGGGYYGSGLYGPLGYGLGYSPFGYSGLTPGGVGYGPLGYGYGYPRSSLGAMVLPQSYAVPANTSPYGIPYTVIPAPPEPQPQPPASQPPVAQPPMSQTDPEPLPLPIPPTKGGAAPATVVVVANEGTKVTFEGIANDEAGTQHSFTTRPIEPGREVRVAVRVDGPGGASTFAVRVRAGEKAVVDLRK